MAHVITAVVDARTMGASGNDGWKDRSSIEQELASVPIFMAIARAEPDAYERIKESFITGVQSGISENEMAAQVRSQIIGQLLPKYLQAGPDKQLIAYYESQVQAMEELERGESADCVSFNYPKGDDMIRLSNKLSDQVRASGLDALTALIQAASQGAAPIPTEAEIRPTLRKAIARAEKAVPGTTKQIANGSRATEEPGFLCHALIEFYTSLLSLPSHEAGPALRYLATNR